MVYTMKTPTQVTETFPTPSNQTSWSFEDFASEQINVKKQIFKQFCVFLSVNENGGWKHTKLGVSNESLVQAKRV
jgi:hypothetical protein